MEAALQALVDQCVASEVGNPLTERVLDQFCAIHSVSRQEFARAFSASVAKQFAECSLAYWSADVAMNRLFGAYELGLEEFAMEAFLAFDEGEYVHSDDPEGTVPWQKYTLPAIMELLGREP